MLLPPDPVSLRELESRVPPTSPDADLWRCLLRGLDAEHPYPMSPDEGYTDAHDYNEALAALATREECFHYAYLSFLRSQVSVLLPSDFEPSSLSRRGTVLHHLVGLPQLTLFERGYQLRSEQLDADVAATALIVFLLARCRNPGAVLFTAGALAEDTYHLSIDTNPDLNRVAALEAPCLH